MSITLAFDREADTWRDAATGEAVDSADLARVTSWRLSANDYPPRVHRITDCRNMSEALADVDRLVSQWTATYGPDAVTRTDTGAILRLTDFTAIAIAAVPFARSVSWHATAGELPPVRHTRDGLVIGGER